MCRALWPPPCKDRNHHRHFGVIRHTERADAPFATVGGLRWTQTEDYTRWPLDPPLSDEGLATAQQLAYDMSDYYQERCSRLDVVVTSPYLRCIQTAVAVCDKLGPNVRLVIDNSLGEIYGPSVMGAAEPVCATRPLQLLRPHLRQRTSLSKVVGEWPVWPEDSRAAHQRFAGRFLWYLRWACKARRNFLLVTHADSVGAALRVIPSHAGQMVERIDYGGMFMASLARDFFGYSIHEMSTPQSASSPTSAKEQSPKEAAFAEAWGSPDWCEKGQAPLAWCVHTEGILLRCTGARPGAALTKRLGALAEVSSPARELVKVMKTWPGAPASFSAGGEELDGEATPCPRTGGISAVPSRFAAGSGAAKGPVLYEIGRSGLLKRRRDRQAERSSA
mmetsp:Transcript_75503/g.221389  ORF Transcript_75503/g.221389 Transcript_75503/m.221389 type:complete len:391 (-) Transcript_75503:126-1298(-)